MDLEAQHSYQSSDTSSEPACQRNLQDNAEASEREGPIAERRAGSWAWLATLKDSLTSHQYTSIPRSSDSSLFGGLILNIKSALLSSYINVLLVFVPVGFATYLTDTPPAWTFATNSLAIVPLSALLTDATEKIASEAGDTIGALLNISLGNLVELILLLVARISLSNAS